MLKPNLYPRTIAHLEATGFTTFDVVGFLPMMLDPESDVPTVEQLHHGYAHGGGWRPASGFTFNDGAEPTLTYPGDPPVHAVAWWKMPKSGDRVILFDSAWTAVIHPDGTYEIARMD